MKTKTGTVVFYNILRFIVNLLSYKITEVGTYNHDELSKVINMLLFHLKNDQTHILLSSGVNSSESNLQVRTLQAWY